MNTSTTPVIKDLVLVGGGHSHVVVLKRFGMRPVAGIRITLITRDVHTPYSGMLPGLVAGHYSYDDSHIDLRPLSRFAGARLYHDEVEAIDLQNRYILCRDHPPVSYDALSINIGSRPDISALPDDTQNIIPVKPIDRFLREWETLQERFRKHSGPFHIAIVGGGAGGVELALCTQYRLRKFLEGQGREAHSLHHRVFTDTDRLLPTHNSRVRRKFERIFSQRGIEWFTSQRVTAVGRGFIRTESGSEWPADAIFWVTHAAAPHWLGASGLKTDGSGFVQVNDFLQSVSYPEVFAAGDVASMVGRPLAKSGVFAVRQGPPLQRNLQNFLTGRPLRRYNPQPRFLSLISTGDRYAVASRGMWALEGRLMWVLKDWIDRRFMNRYNRLPEMESVTPSGEVPDFADERALEQLAVPSMRCGGCGAKVGSSLLSRVLSRLAVCSHPEVVVGLEDPDDAAILKIPEGQALAATVDFFPSFVDDPFVFGQIAANHALGDIHAMGAKGLSVLALVSVPFGLEEKTEDLLYQLLSGAQKVFIESGVSLVGGHTTEGPEVALGFAVHGLVAPDRVLRKSGLRRGDQLILTKPIGTGTLFAADMRRKARGRWIDEAISSMLQSNQNAAQSLIRHQARACTDVTGFGLVGHLIEMLKASRVGVSLDLDAIPLLDGAAETISAGIFSSLHPQNFRLKRAFQDLEEASRHPIYPLLFDPQTAGGLLAGLPPDRAAECLNELWKHGYSRASIIGRVIDSPQPGRPPIVVTKAGAGAVPSGESLT